MRIARALPCLFGCIALVAAIPATARAWSRDIHGLIGQVAYDLLTPQTQAKVDALIAIDATARYPGCEVNSLADAARWPDCVKLVPLVNSTTGKKTFPYSWSKPDHYQDALYCRAFKADVGCPKGKCVSAALRRYSKVLENKSNAPVVRLQALEFIAHYVGDAHQPLHATDNDNGGGNNLDVAPGDSLHSYWDGNAPRQGLKENTPSGDLLAGLAKAAQDANPPGGPRAFVTWLRESHAEGANAYRTLTPATVCGAPDKKIRNLSAEWRDSAARVARVRTGEAAVRLARYLEAAL